MTIKSATKAAVASVTTAITTATAAVALTPKGKPIMLTITDPTMTAIHKVTALIRDGYIPVSIEIYGATGIMNAVLELGNPDPALVDAANADIAVALERQEHQRMADIEEAAKRLVAERERAERKAVIDAQVAEAAANLAALQAAAAAA
jgi:hypothetical protein